MRMNFSSFTSFFVWIKSDLEMKTIFFFISELVDVVSNTKPAMKIGSSFMFVERWKNNHRANHSHWDEVFFVFIVLVKLPAMIAD